MELSSDILQPILLEEWPLLQVLLKVEWPKYAYYYYWIQNSYLWRKQAPDLKLAIYSPYGKYQDDATFVGILSFAGWSVIVFTKEASGTKLREALIKTNRIDWEKNIVFSAVHEYIQPTLFSALETLRANRGIKIDVDIPGYFRIKSAEMCANVKLKIPDECYIAELNTSHIPLINSLWRHADTEEPENSMNLLRASVTLNRSIGLFLKDNDMLVSWGMHNEWHGLGVVQTLESHRRKGYAKVVVNALAKRLGEAGISPILSVVVGNTASENMFESLGWKRTVPATWVMMKKHLRNDN